MKRKKRVSTAAKGVLAVFFLAISLFPIYWLVAMAIRPSEEMKSHITLIPQTFTAGNFVQLFTNKGFGTAIVNSLQSTLFSLIISLVVGITCAYILARKLLL